MAQSVSVFRGGSVIREQSAKQIGTEQADTNKADVQPIQKIVLPTQATVPGENALAKPLYKSISLPNIAPSHLRMSSAGINAALATDAANLGVCPAFRQIRPQFDVHVFDCIDSTSTQLWRMLAQGHGAGTVAIARQQSAGRGQRGRTWLSPPGGLYLSLAVEPDWAIADAAQLTCLSAWGIAIALNNLGVPVQIKWPNDLFFEGKKLGGILTETKVAQLDSASNCPVSGVKLPACIRQAVIGVGINWHNPTPATGISLVKILQALPEASANIKINCLDTLAALVLRGILQGVFFQQRVGRQAFMKDYEKLLTQFGKAVSLDPELLDSIVPSGEAKSLLADELSNRSGEVVGVSEEGYL